jgi:hypothetical protein
MRFCGSRRRPTLQLDPDRLAGHPYRAAERIRQIEAKALRQLRSPERARHLRALLAAR